MLGQSRLFLEHAQMFLDLSDLQLYCNELKSHVRSAIQVLLVFKAKNLSDAGQHFFVLMRFS